jgi:hypothetical protein
VIEYSFELGKFMKKSISIVLLSILAGCGNLQTLNDSMDRSNEMIQGNTTAVTKSSEVIHENTMAVMESTKTLAESKEVIAGSTAFLQQAMNQLNLHPILFPFLMIVILIALILPSVILLTSYRTLSEKLSALLDLLKKK